MKRPSSILRAGGPLALIALMISSAVVIGCGSAPTTRYYLLASPTVQPLAEEGAADPGLRLGVETFVVDPPYDQNRLVYRVGAESGEVGFYEHHRWAATPGRLLSTALASGLRGVDGLSVTEPATVTGRYDLVLSGRVVSLEEVDLPGQQIARLQLDLKLYEVPGETLLWSRLLTGESTGKAEDAADIMRQMQSAFEQLLGELRGELASTLEDADLEKIVPAGH